MRGTHKWLAKVLNLLMALAMVISLVAVLAPAVAAQTPPGPNPDPDCEPVKEFDGCHLKVFVNTYAKDPITGDFTPQSEFDEGDYFYVNAVVVNTGYGIASDLSATVSFSGDFALWQDVYTNCDGNEATQSWADPLRPEYPSGDMADFWWRVCCTDDTGPATISVNVSANQGLCTAISEVDIIEAPSPVYQDLLPSPFQQGELSVVIDTPDDYDEVCTTCPGLQDFTVSATVTNSGDATVTSGWAQLSGSSTNLWHFADNVSSIISFGQDLDPGDSIQVIWDLKCTDPGLIEFNVHVEGQAAGDVVDTDATVHVWQKEFIASIWEAPTTVNVCQVFDVIGQFENCYQEEDSLTGIEATIYWKGDATFLGLQVGNAYQPMYNRCVPWEWKAFDGWGGAGTLNTAVTDEGSGWLSNTQMIPICKCCDTLVRWSFQCLEQEDIEFYVTMEKTVMGPPAKMLYDESEHGIVVQEYKAHLIAGLNTFLQSECSAMLPRDAFAPCQNFHVVMPVVNVGSEEAEDVVLQFIVDPLPFGDTWDIVGMTDVVSGDIIDYTFNPTTGFGTMSLGDIPGDSMKKAILQLHSAGKGQFSVNITDVDGIHVNTGQDIDYDNITIPVYPTYINQGFTPTIASSLATNVGSASATLHGNLGSMGAASSVSVSFEYGTTTAYGNITGVQTMIATDSFSTELTGLRSGTTYHFRAKAVTDSETSYGDGITFATTGLPYEQVISALDTAASSIAEEKSKGFNVTGAENLLAQAQQSFENEDYETALELASVALELAVDIDRDGVPNDRDFAPGIKNIYIYIGPPVFILLLLILTAMLLISRIRKRRVARELIEKEKAEIIDMIDEVLNERGRK